MDVDIVCSAWKHAAVHKRTGKILRLFPNIGNLQNIPSGSTYAKIIKACFEPITGWIFCGSDMDSLEDKINALLTKDPNKIGVYTDGYDGHARRALSYFEEQMPEIAARFKAAIYEDRFYRVMLENGSVEYLHSNDPKLKEYLLGNTTKIKNSL